MTTAHEPDDGSALLTEDLALAVFYARTEARKAANDAIARGERAVATMIRTKNAVAPDSLTNEPVPPPVGRRLFVLDHWESVRDSGLSPQFVSVLNSDRALRNEFISGAEAMGLVGGKKTLAPQQYLLADMLNAGNRFNAVLMPRRSTKTTSIIAWALGRCFEREDYLIAYTVMTTGKKARDRFLKDVAPLLEKAYPNKKERPFQIHYAAGQERVVFKNGSTFQILAPKGDDFRSDAFDVNIFDESGEASTDMGDDVLTAALPTMDTRPGAMLIFAGTGAKFREKQMLWTELEKGREGVERHGILEYSADQETDLAELEEWEDVEPIVAETHPGVGNLTDMQAIHDNFDLFTREQFAAEYLNIFGKPGGGSFLNYGVWERGANKGDFPTPPAHFRLAFAVHPLGTCAAVVGVWREDGKPRVVVLESKPGTAWLYKRVLDLHRKYRVPVAYDDGQSVNNAEADKLRRAKPIPKLEPMHWNDVATGAATVMNEISGTKVTRGGAVVVEPNVMHWDNDDLNTAVRIAKKRGTKESKRWSFGRVSEEDNITPLEAFNAGLKAYDNARPRKPMKIITG